MLLTEIGLDNLEIGISSFFAMSESMRVMTHLESRQAVMH